MNLIYVLNDAYKQPCPEYWTLVQKVGKQVHTFIWSFFFNPLYTENP